jgi:SAM-dependent methyltransferase
MVVLARRTTGLPYAIGSAEALPVASQSVRLVSVGSAVHWFDQARFFEEARRVLHPDGVVIIYDHAGVHLPDDGAFATWAQTVYTARYPTPPRGSMARSTPGPAGFIRCFSETWVDTVTFSHDTLVEYLMTQSNIVDAIETGRETEQAVRSWLAASTTQFFTGSTSRGFGFFAMAEGLVVA